MEAVLGQDDTADITAQAWRTALDPGGEWMSGVLRAADAGLPVRLVHASRGKVARAEPVAALYEQGRVHHVGSLPKLEDQMCEWDPTGGGDSPDRMDALVWGVTAIMDAQPGFHFF